MITALCGFLTLNLKPPPTGGFKLLVMSKIATVDSIKKIDFPFLGNKSGGLDPVLLYM